MDVAKLLAELRQERQQIMETILSLERLARSREPEAASPPKRIGRPPGSKNKAPPMAVSEPAFPKVFGQLLKLTEG
jgi:hypothetical protein